MTDVDDPSLAPLSAAYDLVANVTHEATAGTVRDNSVWRSHVHTRIDGEPVGVIGGEKDEEAKARAERGERPEERWFQIQDLIVEDINPQMIFLGESYLQVSHDRSSSLLMCGPLTNVLLLHCADLGAPRWFRRSRASDDTIRWSLIFDASLFLVDAQRIITP